jgi:hypothetical protein
MERAMSYIYEHVTPKDDMAVVLTDFRFDDLFDHGPSTGAVNVTVQGIGPSPRNPRPGANFNSTKLQVCPTPIYMGPRFAKNVEDEERKYTNYAFAVGWIVHELTHRWSAFVEADIPGSDNREVLVGGAHWARGFHNPSFVSTAAAYSNEPYTETSPMGGGHWDENPDGTFSRRPTPYLAPVGMSAFDLYNMGLLSVDEVPDTFVLVDIQPAGQNRYRARKLPVRIEDVIKAAGPRSPSAELAQREFHFTAYVLHEPGRAPDPEKVQQGREIEAQVARHFEMATGGRMKVTTGAAPSAPSN